MNPDLVVVLSMMESSVVLQSLGDECLSKIKSFLKSSRGKPFYNRKVAILLNSREKNTRWNDNAPCDK